MTGLEDLLCLKVSQSWNMTESEQEARGGS